MYVSQGFPGGSDGKEFACNVGDQGSIPGQGRSLGEEKDNPLLWTEEPGGLQSMGSQRVRLDCVTEHTYTHISQTIMLYTLNLHSANINHISIKLGEKNRKKKKKLRPSPCTTRSFRAASWMVTTTRAPGALGSRGPELLYLPSTFQSSYACFIYKVQGFWLYLAEGIGPRMSISSSQEWKFLGLPWWSSG